MFSWKFLAMAYHYSLWVSSLSNTSITGVGVIIAVLLILLLCLIHELGHWQMAKWLGYSGKITWFPWRNPVFRQERKLTCYVHFASVDFPDYIVTANPRDVRLIALAGPATEALVAGLLLLNLDWLDWTMPPLVGFGLMLALFAWSWVFLANWIPLKFAKNDGWFLFCGKFD